MALIYFSSEYTKDLLVHVTSKVVASKSTSKKEVIDFMTSETCFPFKVAPRSFFGLTLAFLNALIHNLVLAQ